MGLVSSLMRKKGGKLGIVMFIVKIAVKLFGKHHRHSYYGSRYDLRYGDPYRHGYSRKRRKSNMKRALAHAALDAIVRRRSRW